MTEDVNMEIIKKIANKYDATMLILIGKNERSPGMCKRVMNILEERHLTGKNVYTIYRTCGSKMDDFIAHMLK